MDPTIKPRPMPGLAERAAFSQLVQDLRVTELGDGQFLGPALHRNLPRMFGGQVLAQGLVAAGTHIPAGRWPHSLHCYFLSPGNPLLPVEYRVLALRDGGAFSVRRVDAHQGDKLLASISLSFHRVEKSLEHDYPRPHAVGDPLTTDTFTNRMKTLPAVLPAWWTDPLPFDIRFTEDPTSLTGGPRRPPRQAFWFKANGQLPEDPVLHAALLAYVSDLDFLGSALLPHGASWYGSGRVNGASIDHAMWFHEPPRVDQWLYCTQTSPRSHRGRAFCTAEIRSVNGDLVTSASQEGLMRLPT